MRLLVRAVVLLVLVPTVAFAQAAVAAPDSIGIYVRTGDEVRGLVSLDSRTEAESTPRRSRRGNVDAAMAALQADDQPAGETETSTARWVDEPGAALALHVFDERPELLLLAPAAAGVSLHPVSWLGGSLRARVGDPVELERLPTRPDDDPRLMRFRPSGPLDVGVYVVRVGGVNDVAWAFARSEGGLEVEWMDESDARGSFDLGLSLRIPRDEAAVRELVLETLAGLGAEPAGPFGDDGVLMTRPRVVNCGFMTRCTTDAVVQHALRVQPVDGGAVVMVSTRAYRSGTADSSLDPESVGAVPMVEDVDRAGESSLRLLRELRVAAGLARRGLQPGEMPGVAYNHLGLGVVRPDGVAMGRNWVGGVGAALGLETDRVYRMFSLRADLLIAGFMLDEEQMIQDMGLAGDASISGGSLVALSLFMSARATAPIPVVKPYALAGAGVTGFSVTDMTITRGGDEDTIEVPDIDPGFGYSFGAGVLLDPFSRFGLFGEAMWTRTLDGDDYTFFRLGAQIELR